MITKQITLLLLTGLCALGACKKFLDAKPDKKLVVPSTIADLQALLDANNTMNRNSAAVAEGSSGDYYLTDVDFASLNESEKNVYTWGDELVFNRYPNEWIYTYNAVYYANSVLDNLKNLPAQEAGSKEGRNVKGQALFFRARNFLQAAFIWSKAFDSATAATDLAVPLRLNSDFNEPSKQSTVGQIYDQVISDLKESIGLLPPLSLHVMRPSRCAAFALLARTYWAMRDYKSAGNFADSSQALYSTLLDYNTLSASANFPLIRFNAEVLFHSIMLPGAYLLSSKAKIDSSLYASYAPNDLRKGVYFKSNGNGSFGFKGSYDGSSSFFNGITTSEIYLIRAECHARSGNASAAMNMLNTLLLKRWKTGSFTPLSAPLPLQALNLILEERKKELVFRDLRWIDIKRLNKEGAGITLKRNINSQPYLLPPNDNRYALPLPASVLAQTGMIQNPR